MITYSYANGDGSTTFNGVNVAQSYSGRINGVGSKLRFTNLIIRNNYASFAGGIFNDEQSSPLVVNRQITGNAAANNGDGIFNNVNASPGIHNTIVYGNSSGINSYGGSSPTLTYSLV